MTLSELLHAHMDDETQQVAVQLKVVVEQWSEDQSFEDKEDLRYLVKRHSVPVKANTLIDLAPNSSPGALSLSGASPPSACEIWCQ